MFSCEHCKIFKNTHLEKHLWTVPSDSSYILHKKVNKTIEQPDWPSVSFWNIKSLYFTYPHSATYSTYIRFITHCHSLSLTVIFCYSLSFLITRFTTRCTTCLSFYKRSKISLEIHYNRLVKWMIKDLCLLFFWNYVIHHKRSSKKVRDTRKLKILAFDKALGKPNSVFTSLLTLILKQERENISIFLR